MSWLNGFSKSKSMDKKIFITIIGAANAGKKTLISFLKTGEPVGDNLIAISNREISNNVINISNWEFTIIDIKKQELYQKSLLGLITSQADGMIYIIDGLVKQNSDHSSFETSKLLFNYMLEIVETKIPLLILVNKQDQKEQHPLTVEEASYLYNVNELKGRSFIILPCSTKFGTGIDIAIKWFVDKL